MSEAIRDDSIRAQCSDEEWTMRCDLAACYRLFVRYGWTDLIFTHLTARVPGVEDQYLINPYGLLFDEICASNLLKVDFDGHVILGDHPFNGAGHAIHTAVFKNRPDLNVSLHSHTRAGMAVSTMKCGLLPLTQQANEMMENVAYHDYGLSVATDDECARIGRDLGDKHLMIMNNHGLLGCGRTVGEAFFLMYTLENACKVQVDALASGQELHLPDDNAAKTLSRFGKVGDVPNRSATMSWAAALRSLDATDQSYKQ
ncbi:MAG: class II aldolase/adducin family protein [Pseudomonadota bacterium]